jgi:zinc-ribbon domain
MIMAHTPVMKNCQYCGHPNPDNMNFCLSCGQPLVSDTDPTVAFTETPTTVRGQSFETRSFEKNITGPPPNGGRKLLVGLIGIAAFGVVLVVLAVAGLIGDRYYSALTPAPLVSNINRPPVNSSTSTNTNSNIAAPSATATPTPNPSFTPPTEPTKTGSFTVFANGGWQLSEIDTVPLENFRTKVDGRVDIDGVKAGVTPKGVNDPNSKSRRIYPEFATGGLLMRTHYADGKFSNVMAVSGSGSTGQWRNYQDERGRIEFCVNDNSPEKNGGQFTVTVTMTSVPRAKK